MIEDRTGRSFATADLATPTGMYFNEKTIKNPLKNPYKPKFLKKQYLKKSRVTIL
jgi:hypothetical protein